MIGAARELQFIPAGEGIVEEVQGLYGSYSFSEKLLQKIWLRGNFDRKHLTTLEGERINLRHGGKWNRLGGPDFKSARLNFGDGRELVGDIELHLHAEGWTEHRHASDPAYDHVILHVVLFPPLPGHATIGSRGQVIPVATLLPLLDHDLEQFAAEEAVETMANRPSSQILEQLAPLPEVERLQWLRRHAAERWQQKVKYARLRLDKLGWKDACHHAALEILGYRFNRAPMLRLAGAHPLEEWGTMNVDDAYASERGRWSLQGVRPANQPRRRLLQYQRWVRERPDWPERLRAAARLLPTLDGERSTKDSRERIRFHLLREMISTNVCADSVSGSRFDTLVCDGFLPLLTAMSAGDHESLWFHWLPGDQPDNFAATLRTLGVLNLPEQPANHGFIQGLLGFLIEQETSVLSELPAK